MGQSKFKSGLVAGILVALFFGVALYFRVALPYDHVFSGDWIKFTGVDAYYHMRIIDNLAQNFPILNSFDPYMLYPLGGSWGSSPFFDYLLGGIIWLVGLGSPSQHIVDIVGVYFPAILGALTVVPIYFIGKELFNRWAGVISAGLIAILPGEFLNRSILGFTDHHVAEVLFTTVAIMFLILAVKAARKKALSFESIKRGDWAVITKPLVYSLLAGLFLGLYLLSWMGSLLLVLIIFAYFVIQFIIDHLKGRATDYLGFVGTITFAVAMLCFLPASPGGIYLASLLIAIFIPVALAVLSYLMAKRSIKPLFYPLALLGLGLVSLAIVQIIDPLLLKSMIGRLTIFTWPTGTGVLEMEPLLFPSGSFSLFVVWANFTTGFFLSIIALGMLIYLVVRRGEAEKTLFVIWCLLMLAATLSMRRFGYYYSVNVALLTGYISWLILELTGFKRFISRSEELIPQTDKKAKDSGKKPTKASGYLFMTFGVIVIFFLSFFPNISPAVATASQVRFAPSDGWCESLSWLKVNTPEPFSDPDFYYGLYETPVPGEKYDYPETAYGVTAWWDYGYWTTRIGHRIPTSNPGIGHRGEAHVFTAQDEISADNMISKYSTGSRYIIIDHDITSLTDKFPSSVASIGGSLNEFADVYYIREQGGTLTPVLLYYPEYYRSLAVRLYNFDGKEVIPEESIVIAYEQSTTTEGEPYMALTDVQFFDSYEEAEAYISGQETGNYRIVSDDPFSSPVPLEAFERFELVYNSDSVVVTPDGSEIPEVKIFKYSPLPAPNVQSWEALKIGKNGAVLVGELLSMGTASEVTASFLWGTTEACEDGEIIVRTMDSTGFFKDRLSDLVPGTTYYYKAKAVGDETAYSEVHSFTTREP